MDRRDFLRGFAASVVGLFPWFKKKKLFTATKIVVGDNLPESTGGFVAEVWSQLRRRQLKDKGSLWFWVTPAPDVTDGVKLGWRFHVAQDKGNAVIEHAGWKATVPLLMGKCHHVVYAWDG